MTVATFERHTRRSTTEVERLSSWTRRSCQRSSSATRVNGRSNHVCVVGRCTKYSTGTPIWERYMHWCTTLCRAAESHVTCFAFCFDVCYSYGYIVRFRYASRYTLHAFHTLMHPFIGSSACWFSPVQSDFIPSHPTLSHPIRCHSISHSFIDVRAVCFSFLYFCVLDRSKNKTWLCGRPNRCTASERSAVLLMRMTLRHFTSFWVGLVSLFQRVHISTFPRYPAVHIVENSEREHLVYSTRAITGTACATASLSLSVVH